MILPFDMQMKITNILFFFSLRDDIIKIETKILICIIITFKLMAI